MKKIISAATALIMLLSFTACGKSLNYVIDNMPSFDGIVTEFREDEYIVVDVDGDDPVKESYDTVTVQLDVEYSDSMTHFDVGDKVAVYYDKLYTDEDGVNRVEIVYAVLLTEPANREKENVS